MGIAYLPLTEVMAKSDVVSIHTPNDASTRGLISREMLALTKPTALLINCARGPIVDSAALAEALNEGRLGGAGVDVFNQKPPIPGSEPLLHARNELLTPHIAFASRESMLRQARCFTILRPTWPASLKTSAGTDPAAFPSAAPPPQAGAFPFVPGD